MSAEAPKAVEETPVAVPAAATETPAAPAVDAPAAAEPAKEEETTKKEEVKEETKVEPATDGILGYKAPPLLRSLRFSKRYFWFSDDAVEVKKLWNYMGSEKPVVAHPTAAWASQSGKGLLFVTKHVDDKDHPLAVLNLTDLTDLTKEGHLEVSFKLGGGKHVLQAASALERDGWFAALENKSAEGKAEKEAITSSEGYKAELDKLTKPVVPAAAKKAVEDKGKETAKKDEAATETPAATTETPAAEAGKRKKRVSVFLERIASGTGRPEEKPVEKEEKKEAKEEAKPEVKAEPEAAPAATTTEVTPAVPPKTEEKKEEKKDEKPAETATKAKRASIFGEFFRKASGSGAKETEKKEEPVKDTPPVSSTAPQLADPVKDTEPIKPETVTQAPAATEAAKEPAKEEPAKKEEPAATSSLKDKIFGSIKKLETQAKPEEKKEAKPEEKKAETKEEVKKEEPKPETTAAAPAEPALLKDGKRRVSTLLGGLSKKDKKPEAAPAEGDKAETEAKTETKAKSPISSRIGSVFRKQKASKPTEPVPAVATTEKAEEPKKEEAPAPAVEPVAAPAVNGHGTNGTNGTAAPEEPAKPVEGTAPAAPAVQAAA